MKLILVIPILHTNNWQELAFNLLSDLVHVLKIRGSLQSPFQHMCISYIGKEITKDHSYYRTDGTPGGMGQ